MKSRDGKSQRREEKRRKKKIREEKEREGRKKMQVREKVGKSRFTVFFQWFVAQEGRKVGSLKRRVRSHLGRWEMNNCTSLWREAHLEVKMCKTHHSRTTFGSWDVEKSARHCGAKHVSKSKCANGPLFEVEMSTRFEVKSRKNWGVRSTFWRWDVVLRCSYKVFCTLPKVSSSSLNYHHHYTPLHSTALLYTTLHYNYNRNCNYNYNCATPTLHYTTLHYTNYSHNYYYNYNYN